ncbi:MAG: prenyltransferase [Candidatus Omnitrophota bacterium]
MNVKDALIATRPWSFNITFISITTGAILAAQVGKFSFWIYFGCLVGTILLHAGANTLNDYFDTKNSIDSRQAPTALYRAHPIFCGTISLKGLLLFSISLFIAAFAIASIFILAGYRWLWLITLSGVFLAIFYTANPFAFKYKALGEIVVFLIFGPLMIEGSYAAQTFQVSTKTFLISIPLGLLVSLILLSNNIRDLEFDKKLPSNPIRIKNRDSSKPLNIKTLPIIIGKQNSLRLFLGIVIIVFILMAIYIFCGILKWPSLLVFTSIPLFAKLIHSFSRQVPVSADAQTSCVTFLFGLLLTTALLSEVLFPHVH